MMALFSRVGHLHNEVHASISCDKGRQRRTGAENFPAMFAMRMGIFPHRQTRASMVARCVAQNHTFHLRGRRADCAGESLFLRVISRFTPALVGGQMAAAKVRFDCVFSALLRRAKGSLGGPCRATSRGAVRGRGSA